ncbi:MAG: ABC transporter, partial [Candidatus Delongbacteria bacterium]
VPIFLLSSRWLAKLGIIRQDRQAATASKMIEYIHGMPVIRAFNQVAQGQEMFRKALDDFHDISMILVKYLVLPFSCFAAVLLLGEPVTILTGGLRYNTGIIEISSLIIILVLLYSLYTPLLALVGVMELTRLADASLTRIQRILQAPLLSAADEPEEPDGFRVEMKHVCFSYQNNRPVLDNVSFAVPEMTMTAIVGPSGAGKSTILNLISRFWDVDSGSIQIGSVDIRNMKEEDLNKLLTVVFQDVHLFGGTIFDNIAMGKKNATLSEVENAAQKAQAHDFIVSLPEGYQTRLGEGGATLSGGEQQRISIARAILKDAPIVLLDEATAAIDPSNELAIQKALKQLVFNKTLIVVAHKLTTIQAADQILVLDNGHIVESGNHERLVKNK